MKTKNLVCSAVIMVISALLLGPANAQAQPTIKVLPGDTKDIIKVVFCGKPNGLVTIRFKEADGSTILSDKIDGKNLEKGFSKKYKVDREQNDLLWVEIRDKSTSVTYKVFAIAPSEWYAELEKGVNYSVIVSNKQKQ